MGVSLERRKHKGLLAKTNAFNSPQQTATMETYDLMSMLPTQKSNSGCE